MFRPVYIWGIVFVESIFIIYFFLNTTTYIYVESPCTSVPNITSSVHFYPLVKIENEFQQKIYENQYPDEDCATVPKVRCSGLWRYGFSAQLTALRRCLAFALQKKSVAIIDDRDWNYVSGGWAKVFLPLGKCGIESLDYGNVITWDEDKKDDPVFSFMSMDIYNILKNFHDDPRIWWTGQYLKYILRLNDEMKQMISDIKKEIGYEYPIVGVHVRRGDKIGTESSIHPLSEYISRVEAYYTLYYPYLLPNEKRIYLSTDDEDVLKEILTLSNYKTLSSKQTTSTTWNRYSLLGLKTIVTDIFLLAESNLLIGTLSSKVDRVTYELMQTRHVNGFTTVIPLMGNDESYNERSWYCENCGDDPYRIFYEKKFCYEYPVKTGVLLTERIQCISKNP